MRKVWLVTTAMFLATNSVFAQTEVPNIAGSYICKNRCDPMEGTATIDQAGDRLTITNEQSPPATTTGGFNNPAQIYADGWSGGLCPNPPATGTLVRDPNGRLLGIQWCTGSVWQKQ
jgi:hypothetical protein